MGRANVVWPWIVGGALVAAGCQRVPGTPATDDDFGTDASGTTFAPGDADTTTGADGDSTAAALPPDPTECVAGSMISASDVESVADLAGVEMVLGPLSLTALSDDDLAWMQCLRHVDNGFLSINDSPALTSLDGLEGLETVGALDLERNDALEHVDALAGLTSLGQLIVRENAALVSLDGLRDATITGQLSVVANPTLSGLHLAGATHLSAVDVSFNAQLTELRLPGLVDVYGWVDVYGCALLVDLDLSSLEHAEGLVLRELDRLASADLPALRQVDNSLSITEMPALESLSLGSLEQLGSLRVSQSPLLPSIELPELTALTSISLSALPALSELPLLPDDAPLQSIYLSDLPQIEQLDRLGAPLPDMAELGLHRLPLLTDLSVFAGVTSIQESLTLEDLPQLSSLDAFADLTWAGAITLEDLPALTTLAGLGAVELVEYDVELRALPGLTSLAGLGALAAVGNGLFVLDNAQLVSLDGLDALAQLDWGMRLTGNPALTDLDALWPAPVGPLQTLGDTLTISDNGALSQCTVDAYVDALATNGWAGTAQTENNLTCP